MGTPSATYLHVPFRQGNCLIWLLEVDVGEDESLLQHERSFDDGENAT